ncbi:MAG: DUF1800 domain-containing protein, partial [Dehalococcoidia bacterium]|nr:DUF1800 domain-containing protein [Dehalococcoidia bacterium]
QTYWIYRMVKTRRPLEEKIALFWHGVFATGYTKLNQPKVILNQVDMFRRCGLGSFRTLLLQVSRDPAMLFWLDNNQNHHDAVNENYGRELLELFSMGVGNYTEVDVREASRAFTGWTLYNLGLHTSRVVQDSVWPYGRLDWQFDFNKDDHDATQKTFLGQTGDFDGEEIIDIICQDRATARFVSRHLYNFFVADEPQVPAWNTVPPREPGAIEAMADVFVSSNYDICSVLRMMFNSDFFKEAAFAKVKSPVELVAGAVRMTGGHHMPAVEDIRVGTAAGVMGQQVLDPPSVEGWHTGVEWVTTGSLVDRVNFVVSQLADAGKPGVKALIDHVKSQGRSLTPAQLVDSCLDIMGPLKVSEDTRSQLLDHAMQAGELVTSTDDTPGATARIVEMLQMVASTREFQLA